ncbi:hypothetical protein H2199_005059 [Coniosporium tulheliwenetii]|uniref:Uncharacterized protein n=1 Tax=Coniosporium tulheliwenetii TaxID=3383036 RepID=A0ACC2Z3Q5_9PEZI|nr:hypothetical protein H2199_005059 [Cladosporium sp. JES 115]
MEYMEKFDASHDYQHIGRVLLLCEYILDTEYKNPPEGFNSDAVILAAYLHEIGDRKYATPGQHSEAHIAELLVELGADVMLAVKVQLIVDHISYSTEVKNPEAVESALLSHPELAVVQDADRLEALGAVGIARAFTFGGAMRPETKLEGTLEHFTEKLEKLEGMMKGNND